MNKRVLVTGGAGFVAHHIIEHLLKMTDWEIISLDRLDTSGNLNRLADVLDKNKSEATRLSIVHHDLRAPMNEMICNKVGKVNYILHLAAGSHVDRSIDFPMEFVYDNVVGTGHILEFARLYTNDTLEKFLYFSTDEVFGPAPEGVSYKENDRYNSGNPYCLHPDTLVRMADDTLVTIRDINVGDSVLAWDRDRNKITTSKVTNKFENLVHTKHKINLQHNDSPIICSENHTFFVKRENRLDDSIQIDNLPVLELKTKDLNKGDLVAVARKTPTSNIAELSEDYAKFLGYSASDGFIREMCNRKGDEYRYIIWAVEQGKAFGDYYNGLISTKDKHYISSQTGGIKVVRDVWEMPGCDKSISVGIPDAIRKGNQALIKAFVGGFLDANGCIRKDRKDREEVEFCSYSDEILRELELVLRKIGVIGRIFYESSKLVVSDTKSYKIIRNINCLKNLDFNGETSKKPQQAMKDDDIVWYPIASIDVEDTEEIFYDIEVETHHNFLIEDFIITHNSAAKAGGEELAIAYENTYKLPIIVTHTMNLYGTRQHYEKYIPMVIRKVIQGEEVTIHANKECTKAGSRHYISTDDVSDAVLFLLNNSNSGEKYNVVGQEETDNLELAQLIAKILGKSLKYKMVDFHSSRPGHDLRYALDGGKMEKMGWVPLKPLEERLREVIAWSLENPYWIGLTKEEVEELCHQ